MNSFYTEEELKGLGLKSYGKNVLISRNSHIYNAANIEIGDNVRIDDLCILSGKIKLGNNIHIAANVLIFAGDAGVTMADFSGLSSRCAVYAVSDDYSGDYMTNPTVPDKYRHIITGKVYIGEASLIGTGSTILPGVTIGDNVAVGANSLINKDLMENYIYVGVPCHKIKDRSIKAKELRKEYLQERGFNNE